MVAGSQSVHEEEQLGHSSAVPRSHSQQTGGRRSSDGAFVREVRVNFVPILNEMLRSDIVVHGWTGAGKYDKSDPKS